MRKLIAWAFMYSLDGLLADEGTEYGSSRDLFEACLSEYPRNKKFFTLFSKAGSNVVESAAILLSSSLHERWAELVKRVHDTEHARSHD